MHTIHNRKQTKNIPVLHDALNITYTMIKIHTKCHSAVIFYIFDENLNGSIMKSD